MPEKKPVLTKRAFERLLTLAAQPIKKDAGEPVPLSDQTSEFHRPDGCSGTRKHQGKTEGTEG